VPGTLTDRIEFLEEAMEAFELDDLLLEHKEKGRLYYEFLRVPALSTGIYVLPAESADPQQPHGEDEVYFIADGRGMIQVDGEDRPVRPGSIIYVPATVDHRFHSITEDLQILVFFAPAEVER
jgi:mannose-6-phosphate isomerase-like protein (cupin superfamily)